MLSKPLSGFLRDYADRDNVQILTGFLRNVVDFLRDVVGLQEFVDILDVRFYKVP